MKEEKDKLFSSLRWKTYQPVEVLKTKVKRTKEDKKTLRNLLNLLTKR